jgi:hypothetical protein
MQPRREAGRGLSCLIAGGAGHRRSRPPGLGPVSGAVRATPPACRGAAGRGPGRCSFRAPPLSFPPPASSMAIVRSSLTSARELTYARAGAQWVHVTKHPGGGHGSGPWRRPVAASPAAAPRGTPRRLNTLQLPTRNYVPIVFCRRPCRLSGRTNDPHQMGLTYGGCSVGAHPSRDPGGRWRVPWRPRRRPPDAFRPPPAGCSLAAARRMLSGSGPCTTQWTVRLFAIDR